MRRRQTVRRILGIQRVLVKYGLDDVIKETHLLRPLRFLFYVLPRRRSTSAPLGERIRLALEELGPIFVKFGQAISTRRDLLPPDIADELAKLQDEVPPFPGEQKTESTLGLFASAAQSACSRPPPPTTRTFTMEHIRDRLSTTAPRRCRDRTVTQIGRKLRDTGLLRHRGPP